MDEPLSNLDAKLRIEMRAEIRRIHGELDRATIYVTHDQDEALSMADRIVVMKEGVVQQIGVPRDVYCRPRNLHVARFMGYRNVFDVSITSAQGDRARVSSGGASFDGVLMESPGSEGKVSVAIRPDDFERAQAANDNAFDTVVETVEYGGRDSLLRVASPFGPLYARLPGDYAVGERVPLCVPVERTLVYAGERA
ncbi:MAG: ABC transporter ATP-binding protein, partial [Pandoraea sp.]|nr:ABC transporter ATP-binding protein [Pandoraea sp.]